MSNDNDDENKELTVSDLSNILLKDVKEYKKFITKTVRLTMKEVVPPISELINESLPSVSKMINEKITPFINYLDENSDRIDNFTNSLEEVEEHFSQLNNISAYNATEVLKELFNDEKIIMNEDWSISIVNEKTITNNKLNFKLFNEILDSIYKACVIGSTLSAAIIGINNYYSVTDNPDKDIPVHITETTEDNNEYTLNKVMNLYLKPDTESDIIAELEIGDKVYLTDKIDGWTSFTIYNEDGEAQTGWIKNEDVEPITQK